MASCRVDANRSPQFAALKKRYQKEYRQLDKDISEALADIAKDFRGAKNARRLLVTTSYEVYKYRQNSRDIRRGASYGWRIIALFEKSSGQLFPILIYPKTEMEDASDATIDGAIRELRRTLGYCIKEGCEGKFVACVPPEVHPDGTIKMSCGACGAIAYMEAAAD